MPAIAVGPLKSVATGNRHVLTAFRGILSPALTGLNNPPGNRQLNTRTSLSISQIFNILIFSTNKLSKIDSTEEQSLKSLLLQQNNKLDTLLKHISNIHQPYRFQNGRSRSPRNLFSCCEAPLPLIQSATSAFFCLHVIDVKLRALEIHTENAQIQDGIKAGSSSSFSILHDQILDGGAADIEAWDGEDADVNSLSPTADHVSPKAPTFALETLKSAEIIRLIQKYQDIAGMMYPVVDATHPEQLVENVWANRSADKTNMESLSRRNRSQIGIVEMMVAIALTDEDEDSSELMQALHDHVLPDVQYMVWNTRVDLQGLVLLVLVVRDR